MPTDVALEVCPEPPPHVVVGLLLPPQAVEGEALHREGLAVLHKLGVGQDLLGELEAVLVLLLLVAFLETRRDSVLALDSPLC